MSATRAARPVVLAVAVCAMMALAALMFALSRPHWPSRPLGFWLVACTASELLWVRLPLGQATLSMSSCLNLAALLVLPRAEAMLAAAASVAIGESLFMRKPGLRVIFNSAQTAVAVAAGSLAFTRLGGAPRHLGEMFTRFDLLPFAAAGLVYSAFNTAAVSIAVALHEGLSPWRAWWENFGNGFELISRGALLSLGILVAVHYALTGPFGALLLALPLVLAHRGYATRLERLATGGREGPPDAQRRSA